MGMLHDAFHFCSNFPASSIPKVKVTRTPNTIATNPVANRATGKTPFIKATCIVKYLVKPEQKQINEISHGLDDKVGQTNE
jgi:hypothetical protein